MALKINSTQTLNGTMLANLKTSYIIAASRFLTNRICRASKNEMPYHKYVSNDNLAFSITSV